MFLKHESRFSGICIFANTGSPPHHQRMLNDTMLHHKLSEDFQQRTNAVERRCLIKDLLLAENHIPVSLSNIQMFYLAQYNLNYCKVPKCASTFWTHFFLMMSKTTSGSSFLGQPRFRIHRYADDRTSVEGHEQNGTE